MCNRYIKQMQNGYLVKILINDWILLTKIYSKQWYKSELQFNWIFVFIQIVNKFNNWSEPYDELNQVLFSIANDCIRCKYCNYDMHYNYCIHCNYDKYCNCCILDNNLQYYNRCKQVDENIDIMHYLCLLSLLLPSILILHHR